MTPGTTPEGTVVLPREFLPESPPPEGLEGRGGVVVKVEEGDGRLGFRTAKRTVAPRKKGAVKMEVKEEVLDTALGLAGVEGEGESLGERIKRRRR